MHVTDVSFVSGRDVVSVRPSIPPESYLLYLSHVHSIIIGTGALTVKMEFVRSYCQMLLEIFEQAPFK